MVLSALLTTGTWTRKELGTSLHREVRKHLRTRNLRTAALFEARVESLQATLKALGTFTEFSEARPQNRLRLLQKANPLFQSLALYSPKTNKMLSSGRDP